MSNPTAAQLVERLRTIYSAEAGRTLVDEKLVGHLPISLRTLARWKQGDTRTFDQIVSMLAEAGWLSTDEDVLENEASPRDPLTKIAATVVEIGETQKEILRRLPEPAEAQESTAQAAPKRRAKNS